MDSLTEAQADAPDGTSSPAFLAMFKSDTVVGTVKLLLQHIVNMRELPGLEPSPDALLRPRFACAEPSSLRKYEYLKLGYDPWKRCLETLHEMSTISFYARGTAYIFLCPSFFMVPLKPRIDICPTVDKNQFEGIQKLLQRFQIYSLADSLVRFYLGRNALDDKSVPREIFDWNQCVFNLNGIESVINPTNMRLFITRMYSPKIDASVARTTILIIFD